MENNLLNVLNSPLTPEQAETLNHLIAGLSNEQIIWINGYFSGLNAGRQGISTGQTVIPQTDHPNGEVNITVLFGSQTGNAEKLAEILHSKLQSAGFNATLQSMGSYKTRQLKSEQFLFVVVSTQGEGDPPDSAQLFYEFIQSKKAPNLSALRFSVLALGDSSYEYFCKIGQDFDTRLEALGGQRFYPRTDCDVDYEETADAWFDELLNQLSKERKVSEAIVSSSTSLASSTITSYSKRNPFSAILLENLKITGRGSSKDVRHIELSLEDSALSFEPGDSLGILPSNCPELVAELIDTLAINPETIVTDSKREKTTLQQALLHHYEITTVTRPFLEKIAAFSGSKELGQLFQEENRDQLRSFIYGREVIDILHHYPLPGITAEQFIGLLRKLPPRLYSIASSYRANPDEAHLTVGIVRYQSHGRDRKGVATTFLTERIGKEEETIPIYIDSNKNFRLPEDPDRAIIMVGPGTGIAPFRAFMEEREVTGAQGKNWLFFGDRHFHTDFLYQQEWLDYRKNGLLNQIDIAFSRDQEEKVYVQHSLLKRSRELYAWLEEGAYFYVCGDAESMAPDVHEALLTIIEKEGQVSREKAIEYLNNLQQNKRYQRDIY
ncbi:sulfite reductase (NADPH) alpha subunit [Nitrosomonas cryotolerans]|uniref:Sulfite reductase [NADPH] flavoprotein alpha-component n=1 Tax=Nitrosomonas cryotolerans ATCC 49181 TaxID=1131553 RepID=A0A1N6IIL8_9PROT|nr:sulfite reductase (NADPH) alpha subunit [Nitrosomonas cryotolerans]SIO31874.1 sulfite reductase (NADPH) alpha subunit [Nitrosomonas cryotolerans ATCC 49181]